MSVSQASFRSLRSELSATLKSFQSSTARFKIVRSVGASAASGTSSHAEGARQTPPKTLFILDSSFNPPSKAHLTLVASALRKNDDLKAYAAPHRLLLLFSTHNADKAPSAASFDERLALMTIFAEDIIEHLRTGGDETETHGSTADVDIGLTTEPYYTDKSDAIAAEGKGCYPGSPRHVHIMGFDTVVRFLAPKYYKDFTPPLSALDPYFDAGHELRVTLRPSDEYGSVADQKAFVSRLAEGHLADQGGKPEWARQIKLVEAGDGVGVSSTRVRKAATSQRWAEVADLCTPGVAAAVKDNAIYEDDDRGSKMA